MGPLRYTIFGLLLLVAISTVAIAEVRSFGDALTGEKWYIANIVAKKRSKSGERLMPAELLQAIVAIDIDRDDVTDYLVDFKNVQRTLWCGTGGCDFELWRGSKGGHPSRIWNLKVRSYHISNRHDENVFDFDFHGSQCGTFGASACRASFAWDSKEQRMVERPTPTGDTTVRIIAPIPIHPTDVPDIIRRVAHDAVRRCKNAELDDAAIVPVSIPDIDGDGIRDWSLTIPVCEKPNDVELKQLLYTTAGDKNNPSLAASGVRYRISFGTKPATVERINKTDACSIFRVETSTKICTRTRLVWNAVQKKLTIPDSP